MKRFSSLSAFLVGLSFAASSWAAPGQVKQVAKAQPTDPPAAEPAPSTPPPAEPQPQPDTPSASPPPGEQPAPLVLGVGGGTPTVDTAQTSAEDPKKKPKERPWAGSAIFPTVSMSTSTVFQGQQQYYDPTVEASTFILPRYSINDAFQLRGRLVIDYEMTNSDTTTTRNEPVLSDTILTLVYRKIPEFATLKPSVSLNLVLPTSKAARYHTMIFSPGIAGQLAKTFDHVAGGEMLLVGTVGYSHPIYQSKTSELSAPPPYATACAGGNCGESPAYGGKFNTSDAISYTLTVQQTWGKWSPALFYLGRSQWAYTGNDATYMGRTVGGPNDFSAAHVSQLHYFSAWLDYEVNSWLTAEVGYFLQRAGLTDNGTYGNPFFDRYQDNRVYLGVNIAPDALIQQLSGQGEGEGGIVRAQNKKPVLAF